MFWTNWTSNRIKKFSSKSIWIRAKTRFSQTLSTTFSCRCSTPRVREYSTWMITSSYLRSSRFSKRSSLRRSIKDRWSKTSLMVSILSRCQDLQTRLSLCLKGSYVRSVEILKKRKSCHINIRFTKVERSLKWRRSLFKNRFVIMKSNWH